MFKHPTLGTYKGFVGLGIHVVKPHKFSTNETVPESGIYRVTHEGHRLPHEVTLLAGQIFPRCSKCNDSVQFEVVRQALHIQARPGFNVVVYELPASEEEDDKPEAIAK